MAASANPGAPAEIQEIVSRVYRAEYGRIVATLIRLLGDIDLAEEAAQDAFVTALARWPQTGTPPNAGGWLMTTARNRAIDRLRLMFTCCHPALSPEARVALTLRLLGGLTVAEIAAGFLVGETTMAQRLTRAKRKIQAAKIPYRVPADHELPARVRGVLAALYLVFNEGYLSSGSAESVRTDLCAEAIRLARLLAHLMPDEPEAQGLLALMLLTDARRAARVADGVLVPLSDQDRTVWDRDLIAEGHAIVRACLRRNQPGRYQLLAAVNAVHTDAASADVTDWPQILALYDHLHALVQSPVVALNRAVALAEVDGPGPALAVVDALALTDYHPWQATRADLLRRLGRDREASAAYEAAIGLTANSAEQRYLRTRLDQLIAG